MYGQNQFFQRPPYIGIPHYLPNRPPPPCANNWYNPPAHSFSLGSVYNEAISEDPTLLALKKREKNREIIEQFVHAFEHPVQPEEAGIDKGGTLKIWAARETLVKAARMIESLEKLRSDLGSEEDLPDQEWSRKLQESTAIQGELGVLLERFNEAESAVGNLLKRLENRRKKRLRERKKRVQRKVDKARTTEKRASRHAEVDAWIREKRDTIEREKQVELLRKDADIVLSDVRGKRSDARKFLGILQELRNLRRVKVNVARARGENLSPAADQAFDNIIGQLVEQWSCLDREYSIEEQGLKLMLKTDNEQKIERQKRSTFDDWEEALFGKKLQPVDSMRSNVHGLVGIRRAWDKYANFDGVGSRIPIGWIIPVPPSSAAWQRCLKDR